MVFSASVEKKKVGRNHFTFSASVEKKKDGRNLFAFSASVEKKKCGMTRFAFSASVEKKKCGKIHFAFSTSVGKEKVRKNSFYILRFGRKKKCDKAHLHFSFRSKERVWKNSFWILCLGESIDEGLQEFVYYTDGDGDGYGDPLSYFEDCMELTGYVSVGDDCNDEDATIYPGATEIPNNDIDEDCDGMDLVSSFHELEKLGVKIYPNPVKDLLYLEQSSSRILHLRIFNTAGLSVLRKEISSERAAIEISGLASGIYLIRLTQNEEVVFQKIVVE